MKIRPVKQLSKSRPTLEGAGVHLNRAIGFRGADSDFDPFLLLDDFRSDVPEDSIKGFPFHPHRGTETITCVMAGTVGHRDGFGHKGVHRHRNRGWNTLAEGMSWKPTARKPSPMVSWQSC